MKNKKIKIKSLSDLTKHIAKSAWSIEVVNINTGEIYGLTGFRFINKYLYEVNKLAYLVIMNKKTNDIERIDYYSSENDLSKIYKDWEFFI